MHASALNAVKAAIADNMTTDRHYDVVDFGSFAGNDGPTHRDLLVDHDCRIVGIDLRPGRNVDVVMKHPYSIPLPSRSADVVISGQVFEHIPFPFTSVLEIRRVLRPGGIFIMTVPTRGHRHDRYDCWRIYPDGVRAFAAFAVMDVRQVHADFPPQRIGDRRWDYSQASSYWGDTIAVLSRPRRGAARTAALRVVLRAWSNSIRDLQGTVQREQRRHAS
jgi:SAM-dependent methyltransferase